MNEVKNFQLEKIQSKKNYKRIVNEIKKIPGIVGITIDKEKDILHIEINEQVVPDLDENLEKAVRIYEKKALVKPLDVKETFRKVLYLKGLDCAHCAARVESIAKKMFPYEKLVVDFASMRFIIETSDQDLIDHLPERVTEVVKRVDERIVVMDDAVRKRQQIEQPNPINKVQLILVGVGMVFFLFGVLFEPNTTFGQMISKMLHSSSQISYHAKGCFLVTYICVGYSVIWQFIKKLFKGRVFDETFLMTIASIGAIATGHFIEAIMVMVLYQIGEYFQSRAVHYSRKSISELISIDVQTARVKMGTEITEMEVESVLPDDIIVVQKGEMIPLDGKIIEGKTHLDTKNLTGESKYQNAGIGDEIMAGSINMGNVIELKVLRPHGESMMSKILDMVENASSSKSKAENFITKFSKYYTPIVVILALLIGVLGYVITYFSHSGSNPSDWILRAMAFLVVSCPCALVISIPLCFFSSIGVASKRGILIKGSNYLEALNHVENVVFDKTGTLTKGEFAVTEIVPANDTVDKDEMLRLLIYTEYYSLHPIGVSIVDHYGRDNIFPEIISDFQDISSGGARATINGSKILVGNTRLMKNNKFDVPTVDASGIVIHITREKAYLGYVVIGDVIREEAEQTIRDLRKQGVNKFYILTGDSRGIAENVANILNVDEVYSELLPDQKVELLEDIKHSKRTKHGKTIFIGDGINDAPVISCSDVGIAMGSTGSDATIAIADVVIMSDNLTKLEEAVYIAKKTRKKVVQNIVFALSIKLIVMILELVSPSLVPLWLAVFSDVGVSLLAILNALLTMRMYHTKKTHHQTSKETIKDE